MEHTHAAHIQHDSSCCGQEQNKWYQNRLFKICVVGLLLWLASYYVPAPYGGAALSAWRNAFWMYFKAVWLAVLVGLLLGGIIDHYVPREYISMVLAQKKKRTIFYAVGLGFLASACSHGILALAIQLHKKGASGPAVVSFLLAAPWANFPVTLMMFGFFGLKAFWIILSAAFIPAHIFHAYLGPTFLGLLVTLAFATIIEVCSEGSAPLAFEIFRQTGALGNSFVFLMAGVVTDYTEIGLLWANVGRKTALWLPVVCVPQVVLLGWAFNLLS
jgi:uncharacterized membrane protein YraQ (UPF0718 family)